MNEKQGEKNNLSHLHKKRKVDRSKAIILMKFDWGSSLITQEESHDFFCKDSQFRIFLFPKQKIRVFCTHSPYGYLD